MNRDALLIESVREYPMLYDPGNLYYHDHRKKDEAWQAIAENFDMSASMCRKRWFGLRDCHRKALKKRPFRRGKNLRPWKFDHLMTFLETIQAEKAYIQEEKSITKEAEDSSISNTIKTTQDASSDAESSSEKKSEEKPARRKRPRKHDNSTEPLTTLKRRPKYNGKFSETELPHLLLQSYSGQEDVQSYTVSEDVPKSYPVREEVPKSYPVREEVPKSYPVREEVPKSYRQREEVTQNCLPEQVEQNESKSDALSLFFRAMEETIRGFSVPLQIDAKGKIAAIVNALEVDNFQSQQQQQQPQQFRQPQPVESRAPPSWMTQPPQPTPAYSEPILSQEWKEVVEESAVN